MARPTPSLHLCPVCGYPGLVEAPRSAQGGGSYEICPSCGFQFGVTDDDRGETFETWREAWRKRGCPWSSRGVVPPPDWNPREQLRAVTGAGTGPKPRPKPKPKRPR